ncbi:MAG TPA: hypothetical protein VII64_01940 [Thermodesulfobacteriota bacterium]
MKGLKAVPFHLFISLVAASCGIGGGDSANSASGSSFKATEIPVGYGSAALSINDSGAVTGWVTSNGEKQAFAYSASAADELAPGFAYSVAHSIDQGNRVAGEAGSLRQQAFIGHGGTIEFIPLSGALISSVRAINNTGQAAGFLYDGGVYKGFIYGRGRTEIVGQELGRHLFITDINGTGAAAGHIESGGSFHAMLYTDGAVIDIGTLGGEYSSAASINDSGVAAGVSELGDGSYAAFIYDGTMRTLGSGVWVESGANSINGKGEVVGWIRLADGRQHGFLFERGAMRDLNTLCASNCEITDALDINNLGEIAAVCGADGTSRILLLKPS